MKFSSYISALVCSTSVLALSNAAFGQDAQSVEAVVVTGSRVISSSANSPTPLTVVSAEQLQATTPTNIPDALNKLPVFQGSSTPDNINNAGSNYSGNVLSLRNFGAQRTLVLMDGHRVTPTNSDGTVDTDTLPQMLMSRVDVVTGGASAVYGSDAVTGVVNFVLDKKYSGVKTNVSGGISNYGDGASYQFGLAAGTDLFGGRGHIEGSFRYYSHDAIKNAARPFGTSRYTLTGAGTAANPYVNTGNATRTNLSFGGYITCAGSVANPCTANGQQFVQNGVIGPFNFGNATGTPTIASGGDGAYSSIADLQSLKRTAESFARFSYDITNNISGYVQAIDSQSFDFSRYQNTYMQTGSLPNTFFKNNPFLPASTQAQLAGGTSNTFSLAKYFFDPPGSYLGGGIMGRGLSGLIQVTAGLDGTWGQFSWDAYFTHGETRLHESDPGNQNNQKMYASEDAVLNSAGNVVCYVSTTAFASLYPGCVPLNPFGPTTLTANQYNYFAQTSSFLETQSMDDFGGSISGELIDLPAGPVKGALSGSYRSLSYQVSSPTPPGFVDCTGLRLCNTATPIWQENVQANQPYTTQNVLEFAAEANIPLLKDIPLIESLAVDVAGRYTDYSVSGPVQTWKVGLDYHVDSNLRFRGTTSIDIRAPTLVDLFSPIQLGAVGFVDPHTNFVGIAQRQSQGNPNLVPEVARTYTGGFVLTPDAIPGFEFSVDYYRINLKNAIGSISGTTTGIAQTCDASGGTSPYCALFIRPLPFSNTTPANYPTVVLSQGLNTTFNKVEGWDVEANYRFDLADISEGLPGSVSLRSLFNYQAVNKTQNFVGAPITYFVSPKGRVTSFVSYNLDNWSLDLQDRWLSGYNRSTQPGTIIYQQPHGVSVNYVDATVTRKITVDTTALDVFLSIQNLGNKGMPVQPDVVATPGLWAGGIQLPSRYGLDKQGRYFTLGVRAEL